MKHVTIVTQNRPGVVADVATLLGEAGVNIVSIDGSKVRNWAIVKLEADCGDLALDVLGGTKFTALADDTLLLHIEDKPGALGRVAARFKDAALDLRAVRFIDRDDSTCLVAVSAADVDAARALVSDVLL